jgi:hypothetical protein
LGPIDTDVVEAFNAAMTDLSRQWIAPVMYDSSSDRMIVDVGGGNGALLPPS